MAKEKKSKFPWIPLLAVAAAYGAIWNPIYVQYILYDPMLAALGVSNTQLGLISTIRTIFGLICMIPGGWICDKFDTKKVLIICSLGIVPFTVLEVLTVDIYWLQVVSFCGMAGCTNLGFWPATLKAVRIIGGKEHQSSSFGVFEAVQGLIASLGNSLALVVFAWFVNSVAGYKVAMLSMAVYIVLCAVFVYFAFDENKNAENIEVSAERKKFSVKETIAILKMPETWLVSIVIFAAMGFYNNQTYTTPYFTNVLGIAVTFGGAIAIVRDYGIKILGGPIGGWIGQRISATLLNSVALIVCGTLFFLVPRISAGNTAAIIIILLGALVGNFAKATMWATVDEADIPLHLTGTAIGIISVLGNSAPNMLFPLINGYILDRYADDLQTGYSLYFTIIFFVCIVGAVAGFILLAKRRKSAGRASESQ